MLLPGHGNVGAIRTRDNKRKLLNQDDGFYRIAGTTVQASNVAAGIRQKVVYVVSLKVLSKLAVAFLETLAPSSGASRSFLRRPYR